MNDYGAHDVQCDPPRSEPDPDYAYDQMREDEANELALREAEANLKPKHHLHRCPECHISWECRATCPIWEQQDSDCRWYEELLCELCLRKPSGPMPTEFWRVYNRVAYAWYETEYGQIEQADRWYHPAMIFLERIAARYNRARVRGVSV